MNIYLKKLNFNDKYLLDKIFEWRNDETTRKNSINTNIITEEIFLKIIDSFKKSKIEPYIIEYNNENIGYISFSDNDDKIYIGINIDKKYRGKGLSSIALKNMLNIIKEKYTEVKYIYAKIKLNNISSIKIFSKYFNFVNDEGEYKIFYFNTLN